MQPDDAEHRGRYLEALAKADVLLIGKTGTLTLGRPQTTDTVPLEVRTEEALLHRCTLRLELPNRSGCS
ncbi:hypothetical protein ACFC08_22000 [Streptomyces sp. NPDC056112]|uniref:hypothetical protein n=1 Tax=unclassified Streptomyces TaxID=2593676 RepID=UPI001CD23E72|nr:MULTISPECIES: hypothetical protein [unclassified Streptomyces]